MHTTLNLNPVTERTTPSTSHIPPLGFSDCRIKVRTLVVRGSPVSHVCPFSIHALALTFTHHDLTDMGCPALLPVELIDMIFTWARLGSRQESADLGTLLASCRVCKAWLAPAQALLFRDIPISLCHLKRSLLIGSISDRPDLGRHIRSFGMEITSPPVPWGRDRAPKERSKRYRRMISDFIAILTHAPNLTRLSIDIDGEFDAMDISSLLSVNLRHIEVLNWEGRPTSSALYVLLALWPSIRHLRIDSLYLDPLPEDFRPPSLRSLCVRDNISEGFMRWLLPTDDEEPLRELRVESSLPSWRVLKDVQPHAHTLHVLTVDQIPPQSFLDALIALKELTFCELPRASLDLPRSVLRVMYHFKCLPQRRQHNGDTDGQHNVPPVDSEGDDSRSSGNETRFLIKALKELPNLAFVGAASQTPETTLASLNKFCREAGVEFFVCDSIAVYSVSFAVGVTLSQISDLLVLRSTGIVLYDQFTLWYGVMGGPPCISLFKLLPIFPKWKA